MRPLDKMPKGLTSSTFQLYTETACTYVMYVDPIIYHTFCAFMKFCDWVICSFTGHWIIQLSWEIVKEVCWQSVFLVKMLPVYQKGLIIQITAAICKKHCDYLIIQITEAPNQ